jgi:cysteine synthase A
VDGFICAVGTGGTLAGVSAYLKQKNPQVVTAVSDPGGSAIASWVKTGQLSSEGSSISEGIGQGRVTGNLDGARIDDGFHIDDTMMLEQCFSLLRHEGFFLGGSSGVNVAGAIQLAKALGPGKTIVTILCDSGARYQSKLYNPQFLRSKGHQPPEWLEA